MHLSSVGETPERLTHLLNYLQSEYYNRIESLCEESARPLSVLQNLSLPYAGFGQKLIHQIELYMRLRRIGLVPYIHELLEKEDSGHDCRNCSSHSCDMQHGAQIEGITEAHSKIKEALQNLRSAETPAMETSGENEAFKTLQSNFSQLEATLTELFYLEDSTFIPLIIQAQKAIHAGS